MPPSAITTVNVIRSWQRSMVLDTQTQVEGVVDHLSLWVDPGGAGHFAAQLKTCAWSLVLLRWDYLGDTKEVLGF